MHMEQLRRRSAINALKTAAVFAGAAAIILLWGDILRDVVSLFFGACIFAFLLSPLARLLEGRFSRSHAAFIALAGSSSLLLILIALLLPILARQLSMLAESLPQAFARIRGTIESAAGFLQKRLPGLTLPSAQLGGMENGIGSMAREAISTLGSAAGSLYRLFLMAVLSYFLLADRERILLRLELAVPCAWRRMALRAGHMLMHELRLYLRGQATIALAVGLIAGLALAFIGLRSPVLLGSIVGIFNVIPYFGPLLGGVPAVLIALGSGWQKALLTVLILFLVQQIDGMVISPRVMGNITGFSPAVVLIAIFIGARIGSIGGMLLALPALMAIRTLYRVFVQRHEKN